MAECEAVDDDKARTLFCGNLHHNVTEDLLYELFLQGGPIQRVSMPKSKQGGHRNFGFITYTHQISVRYAIELFAETSLFNRRLSLKPSTQAKDGGNHSRPDELNVQAVERNARMLDFSNDALRHGGGGNSMSLLTLNRMTHMEPTTIATNILANSLGAHFNPMMLLNMGANLLGGLSNELLSTSMPHIYGSNNSSGNNNDNLKMKNDRSHGSGNNEPYRRDQYNRTERNRDSNRDRDSDRDRYNRGRDRRSDRKNHR